ncbi:MAG: lipopolysaccharide biosynthesis protein [Eubacteriales bacterium]
MENKYTKSKVVSSLFWKLLERMGTSGIQFVMQIVLARLLLPHYFGTLAIVGVFISFANIFVQSGFNLALVQKKDADEKDFSSVFFLSLAIASLLYTVIYITSPFIASFYKDPLLSPILRVLSFTLFIGVFNSIQNAYIARNMMFKSLFFSSLGAALVSGSIGILSAFCGTGIWALVIQQLTSQLTISIILWFTVKWRPCLIFSFEKVRSLFSYGWKLLVSNIIYILYQDLRTLIIGKLYNSSILGFYNRGESFPHLIVSNIDGSIQSVMFPTFSAHQDNTQRLKDMIRRSIVTSSFLIFPAMTGLAMVAEPLVKILLTERWLPAVPFLQIFCIMNAIRPIQGVNLQIINAMGRSDINLKLLFIKRGFDFIVLLVSIPFGIYALAIGTIISAFFSMIVNISPNKKLLNYSYKEQFNDLLPALLISLFMGVIISLFNFLNVGPYLIMLIQIITGMLIYMGLANFFKIDSWSYITSTVKDFIKAK